MRILDPNFKYVPSRVHEAGSDYLRKKFRRLMRKQKAREEAGQRETAAKVAPIAKGRKS